MPESPLHYDLPALLARLAAAQSRTEALQREFQAASERYQALTASFPAKLSHQELLRRSAYARLYTRLATMPVIEQAKGILLAQQGCTAEEAFTLLRHASQRSNVPIRKLAAQIVSRSLYPAPSQDGTTRADHGPVRAARPRRAA